MTENQIRTGRKTPNWKCAVCDIGRAEHTSDFGHDFKMKPRGFAALSKEQVHTIASMGGKAAHAKGTAHQFTPEEARAAGIKGGIALHKRRGPLAKGLANPGITHKDN